MSVVVDLFEVIKRWGMRFQNPKLKKTTGRNPRWVIRPVLPILQADGTIVRRQQTITLGDCASTTKAEAVRAQQAAMANINGGGVIEDQITLGQLLEQYRQAKLPLVAKSTRQTYEYHLRNHISDLATMRLPELTPLFLQRWLLQKELAPSTKLDLKNLLSSLFECARKWGMYSKENPLRRVELGRLLPVREKYLLTEEQLRRLQAALDCCPATTGGVTGPDVRLMTELLLVTGWRLSELLGLRHDAIEGHWLRMRRRWYRGEILEAGKTGAAARRNYIGPDLAALLGARPGPYLFGGEMPPDERSLQQYILRPAAESVGVYRPGFGFRLFRRQNISWRQEAGATPAEVVRAVGHTRMDTSLLYTVVDAERERAVIEALQGRVN